MRNYRVVLLAMLLASCVTQTPAPTGSGSGSLSNSEPQVSVGMEQAGFDQILAHAEDGEPEFMFELGAMYHDGDGVEQNYAEAIEWYTKAAQAGDRMAQFNLGMMYQKGEGTDIDLTRARRYFNLAAAAGDVRASTQLGLIAYEEKDFTSALEHFTKASMGNFAEAQLNVGVLHIRGEGVPQDLVEGCAWLTVSRDGGWERAGDLLSQLQQKLSTEQAKRCEERGSVLKSEIKTHLGR